MRSVIPFYVLAAAALANAFVVPEGENLAAFTNDIAFVAEKNRLIQLSPSETRWVSEEQKLELKRVRLLFSFPSGISCKETKRADQ